MKRPCVEKHWAGRVTQKTVSGLNLVYPFKGLERVTGVKVPTKHRVIVGWFRHGNKWILKAKLIHIPLQCGGTLSRGYGDLAASRCFGLRVFLACLGVDGGPESNDPRGTPPVVV